MVQIAKDHKWEETWDIDPKGAISNDAIRTYLDAQPYESVAVELLFADTKETATILGVVYNNKFKVPDELAFIEAMIRVAKDYTTIERCIDTLEDIFFGERGILLVGDPDLIRIGIVNHWFSVGPCCIWEKGQPRVMSYEVLDTDLASHPRVSKSSLNYQGISFLYNVNSFNAYHWINVACGVPSHNEYIVDQDRVIALLKDLYHFKV